MYRPNFQACIRFFKKKKKKLRSTGRIEEFLKGTIFHKEAQSKGNELQTLSQLKHLPKHKKNYSFKTKGESNSEGIHTKYKLEKAKI